MPKYGPELTGSKRGWTTIISPSGERSTRMADLAQSREVPSAETAEQRRSALDLIAGRHTGGRSPG